MTLGVWSAMALAVTLAPGPDTMLVAGHAAKSGARAGLAATAGIVAGGMWYMALCGFGYLSIVSASPPLYLAVKIAGAAYLLFIGIQMIRGAFRLPPSAKGCVSPQTRNARTASPSPAGRGDRGEGPNLAREVVPGPLQDPSPHPRPLSQGERGVARGAGLFPRRVLSHAGEGRLGAPFRQGLLTNVLNPKVAIFYLAALPQFVGQGPDAPAMGMLLIAIHYVIGALWLSLVALGAARAGEGLKKRGAVRWLEGAIGVFFVGLAGRLAIERT